MPKPNFDDLNPTGIMKADVDARAGLASAFEAHAAWTALQRGEKVVVHCSATNETVDANERFIDASLWAGFLIGRDTLGALSKSITEPSGVIEHHQAS